MSSSIASGWFRRQLSADMRLVLSFLAVAFIAILTGGIGFFSYERVETKFQQVAEENVPALANSLLMVEQAAAVNALASSLAAASDQATYQEAKNRVETHQSMVRNLLGKHKNSGIDSTQLASLEQLQTDLFNAVNQLEQTVGNRLQHAAERRHVAAEARMHHQAILAWLTPKIDDANFDLVINTENATASLSNQLTMLIKDSAKRLDASLKLRGDIQRVATILTEAIAASDMRSLERLQQRFNAAVQSMERGSAALANRDFPESIIEKITALAALGVESDGVFRLRMQDLGAGHLDKTPRQDAEISRLAPAVKRLQDEALRALHPYIVEARTNLMKSGDATVKSGSVTINGLIDESVANLASYLSLASESNWLSGLLRHAAIELDPAALQPLAEEIDTAILHLADIRNALVVANQPTDKLDLLLEPIIARAAGPNSLIELRRAELAVAKQLQRNVALTHDLAWIFTHQINLLVEETQQAVIAKNISVNRAINGGRWILMALLGAILTIAAIIVLRERMYRQRLEESADELQRHHDHLQVLVNERTTTIAEQAEELRTALAAEKKLSGLQRQFVSMVCHEFRTPLAIIDGNAQRLLRRRDRITPERQESGLGKIRTAVIRLTDLMESVLSAARLEAGSITFEPASCDLGEMIREVSDNHREVNPSHQIIVDVDRIPKSFCADIKLMRQVISNLISNAIKYSPDGEHVWIAGYVTENDHVRIDIKDEGVGIPPEEQKKLFNRFFRASTSTGIAGTGIGLHLVKTLIDLHGGQIEVASTSGSGTVFSITLPPSSPNETSIDNLSNQAA